MQALCQLLADGAEANDADRLAQHLTAGVLVPCAGFRLTEAEIQVAHFGHDEGNSQLGNGAGVGTHAAADIDPLLLAVGDIDVVGAYAELDDSLELGAGVDERLVHLLDAYDERVGILAVIVELLDGIRLAGAVGVDDEALVLKLLDVRLAVVEETAGRDDDLAHSSSSKVA